MRYFIIENQKREDGEINTSTTARNNFSGALSLYHERISKMAVTNLYTSVSVMMVDENLEVILKETIIPNEER